MHIPRSQNQDYRTLWWDKKRVTYNDTCANVSTYYIKIKN